MTCKIPSTTGNFAVTSMDFTPGNSLSNSFEALGITKKVSLN